MILQVQRAAECEHNAGKAAVKPALGSPADEVSSLDCSRDCYIVSADVYMSTTDCSYVVYQGKAMLQEDDPLDAFMADLNSMDKPQTAAPPPNEKKRKADVGLDEEEDNVASFMEVGT